MNYFDKPDAEYAEYVDNIYKNKSPVVSPKDIICRNRVSTAELLRLTQLMSQMATANKLISDIIKFGYEDQDEHSMTNRIKLCDNIAYLISTIEQMAGSKDIDNDRIKYIIDDNRKRRQDEDESKEIKV